MSKIRATIRMILLACIALQLLVFPAISLSETSYVSSYTFTSWSYDKNFFVITPQTSGDLSLTATNGSDFWVFEPGWLIYKGFKQVGDQYWQSGITPMEAGNEYILLILDGDYDDRVFPNITITFSIPMKVQKVPPLEVYIDATREPAIVGDTFEWGILQTGGLAPYQYTYKMLKENTNGGFDVIDGTTLTTSNDLYSYTFGAVGNYKLEVIVKSSVAMGEVVYDFSPVVSVRKPLSITSVTANKTSTTVGTAISWTATATGGSGNKTYRFLLYKNGVLFKSSSFTTASTYKYTPTAVGTYKVRAYVRDSTGTVAKNSSNVTVQTAPLALASVTANRTNTTVGTAITWTAAATGGNGTKTYRFLLYKNGVLFKKSSFTTAATYKYTPTAAGTYKVRAYVRDSTGTVARNSSNTTVK